MPGLGLTRSESRICILIMLILFCVYGCDDLFLLSAFLYFSLSYFLSLFLFFLFVSAAKELETIYSEFVVLGGRGGGALK